MPKTKKPSSKKQSKKQSGISNSININIHHEPKTKRKSSSKSKVAKQRSIPMNLTPQIIYRTEKAPERNELYNEFVLQKDKTQYLQNHQVNPLLLHNNNDNFEDRVNKQIISFVDNYRSQQQQQQHQHQQPQPQQSQLPSKPTIKVLPDKPKGKSIKDKIAKTKRQLNPVTPSTQQLKTNENKTTLNTDADDDFTTPFATAEKLGLNNMTKDMESERLQLVKTYKKNADMLGHRLVKDYKNLTFMKLDDLVDYQESDLAKRMAYGVDY
jgi:hypothetical protein